MLLKRTLVLVLGVAVLLAPLPRPAAAAGVYVEHSGVWARVDANQVRIGNGLIERRWSRAPFRTTALLDRRGGRQVWGGPASDFTLLAGPLRLAGDTFRLTGVHAERTRTGVRVRFVLSRPGLVVTRTVEGYPGVAGLRTTTAVRTTAPLVLSGAELERVAAPAGARPTRHAFRAGADWREPGWTGPPLVIGDPHAGTWRDTSRDPNGPGHWLSLARGARSAFMVTEANNWPSVRTGMRGGVAMSLVDYTRDVVILGPLEESGHVENPLDAPLGRVRVLDPGRVLTLPAVFTGVGRGEGDEPWQFAKYLNRFRSADYPKAVVFNSNGVDTGRLSPGAKDDMDFPTTVSVARRAKEMGVEIFVLDDGWQGVSGDWDPDPARFPDQHFRAVRRAIAPMKLGLWMSPLHFNPASTTMRANPHWVCAPVGWGTTLLNILEPESGSNDAGIGQWSKAVLDHVEARIRKAIVEWEVVYFKFDFVAWLDCLGQGDFYDQHDAFIAMLDRVQTDFPTVTLQMDETNDYRMFPFESVPRGPSWFQNGTPGPERLLHNLWNLSPYVPTWSLGQHTLGGRALEDWPVETLMAVSLLSHVTFFHDVRKTPAEVVPTAREWVEFYKNWRGHFTGGVVYPLLRDPMAMRWTALQAWDPEAANGALLVFRQDAGSASARVALRNVPDGRTFELRRAPDGAVVGTATSAELRRGVTVSLPPRGAQVLLITAIA